MLEEHRRARTEELIIGRNGTFAGCSATAFCSWFSAAAAFFLGALGGGAEFAGQAHIVVPVVEIFCGQTDASGKNTLFGQQIVPPGCDEELVQGEDGQGGVAPTPATVFRGARRLLTQPGKVRRRLLENCNAMYHHHG